MFTAEDRGWGDPGPPGSAVGTQYRVKNIVTVDAGHIRLLVHRGVAPLFKWFVSEIAFKGYALDKVADDWGYAHRYIRGSYSTLSNHSWGLAVDLNATTNPMTSDGRVHTDMPSWVVQTGKKYGFFWGGDYVSSSRRDPMHYEFLSTPTDAARLINQLSGAFVNQLTPVERSIMADLPRTFLSGTTGPEHAYLNGRHILLSADEKKWLADNGYISSAPPAALAPIDVDYFFGPVIPRSPQNVN